MRELFYSTFYYDLRFSLDISFFLGTEKKFIIVEMAYFSRWWSEQNEQSRNNTRKVIERGQLKFTNGGWCMNDEATAYYEDIIDQMTLGHQFLKKELNYVPTIGW